MQPGQEKNTVNELYNVQKKGTNSWEEFSFCHPRPLTCAEGQSQPKDVGREPDTWEDRMRSFCEAEKDRERKNRSVKRLGARRSALVVAQSSWFFSALVTLGWLLEAMNP